MLDAANVVILYGKTETDAQKQSSCAQLNGHICILNVKKGDKGCDIPSNGSIFARNYTTLSQI